MSVQIHTIKGNQYAYEHFRDGGKVRSAYLYQVNEGGKKRSSLHGGGAPVKSAAIDAKGLNSNKDNHSIGQKPKETKKNMDAKNIEKQIENLDIQYQQSNGGWSTATPEQKRQMISGGIETRDVMARRQNREMMTDEQAVVANLKKGNTVQHGQDWYDNIRIAPPRMTTEQRDARDERERKSEKKLYELDHDIY